MEINRRAMSSYHFVGRTLNVDLPVENDTIETQRQAYSQRNDLNRSLNFPNGTPHHMALCGMFPLEKACNFSVSLARTWYCYQRWLQCCQSMLVTYYSYIVNICYVP